MNSKLMKSENYSNFKLALISLREEMMNNFILKSCQNKNNEKTKNYQKLFPFVIYACEWSGRREELEL